MASRSREARGGRPLNSWRRCSGGARRQGVEQGRGGRGGGVSFVPFSHLSLPPPLPVHILRYSPTLTFDLLLSFSARSYLHPLLDLPSPPDACGSQARPPSFPTTLTLGQNRRLPRFAVSFPTTTCSDYLLLPSLPCCRANLKPSSPLERIHASTPSLLPQRCRASLPPSLGLPIHFSLPELHWTFRLLRRGPTWVPFDPCSPSRTPRGLFIARDRFSAFNLADGLPVRSLLFGCLPSCRSVSALFIYTIPTDRVRVGEGKRRR